MAYFDQEYRFLKWCSIMLVLNVTNRPNMFVKELTMYIDYLKNEIKGVSEEITAGQIKKWNSFKTI
jgi:hypothetical protein